MATLGELNLVIKSTGGAAARKELESIVKASERAANAGGSARGPGNEEEVLRRQESAEAASYSNRRKMAEDYELARIHAADKAWSAKEKLLEKEQKKAQEVANAGKGLIDDLATRNARVMKLNVDFSGSGGSSKSGAVKGSPLFDISKDEQVNQIALDGDKKVFDNKKKGLEFEKATKLEMMQAEARNERRIIEERLSGERQIRAVRQEGANGGRHDDKGAFLSRTTRSLVALEGVKIAAGVAAAVIEGFAKGGVLGVAKALESVPIIGGALAAGRALGKELSGQADTFRKVAFGREEQNIKNQINSFSRSSSDNAIAAAREQYSIASETLLVKIIQGEITEANADKLLYLAAKLRNEQVAFAEREKKFGIRKQDIGTQAVQSRLNIGQLAETQENTAIQVKTLQDKLGLELANLAIERERAQVQKDTDAVSAIDRRIKALTAEEKQQEKLLKLETAREVARQESRLDASHKFLSSVSSVSSDEAIKLAEAEEKRVGIQQRINELTKIGSRDAIQQNELALAKNELDRFNFSERVRLRKEEFGLSQRAAQIDAETAGIQKLIERESDLSEDVQRDAAIDARIAAASNAQHETEVKQLQELKRVQTELATQKRADRLEDINAETNLISEQATGTQTALQQRIGSIIEDFRKRERDAPSDDVRKALKLQEEETVSAEIRKGAKMKTFDSTAASFLAFGGPRNGAIKEPDANTPYLISAATTLKEIAMNTSKPAYAVAA